MTIRLLVVCVASLVLLPSVVVGDYTLIAANSEWKYDETVKADRSAKEHP